MPQVLRRWRHVALLIVDVAVWGLALELAMTARFEVMLDLEQQRNLLLAAVLVAVLHATIGYALRLYQGRYRVGSVDELTVLGLAVLIDAIGLTAVVLLMEPPRLVPRSVPLMAAVIALLGMLVVRASIRRLREGAVRPRAAERTLVFGAGAAGQQLIRSMLLDRASPLLPVGLLDDDPGLRHRRMSGVRMLGNRNSIAAAAAQTGASVLVVAIPTADAALVREVSKRSIDAGLTVKVLPKLEELLSARAGIRDVRDIDLEDVLGRRQLDTDVETIGDYLNGRRVLVTGAGGSIGAELCRQVSRFGPAELIMLDRDESALHAVQLSLHGVAALESPALVLADIRDAENLRTLFLEHRPEVVFHAAALKHVSMLERHPAEAWKTNVLGTRNVLAAAADAGVSCFVNISTDKAADPVNVLGRSKRLAERITADYAARTQGTFLSVRFGNVLGSRGSVLTTFAAQIAGGGPVTVTDPRVTRYFMTISEAVQLLIQAAAIGRDGEALVLDMGEPVRIAEVAEQLIAMGHNPIEIVYTGLKPGEKLHEALFGMGESDFRPLHPLISHVAVPRLDGSELTEVGWPQVATRQPAQIVHTGWVR